DDEIVGLIGPNGSGKSTFLNAINGLVPASGTVRVDGKKVALRRPGAVSRRGVLRTFPTPQGNDVLTCLENVLVGLPGRNLRPAAGCRSQGPATEPGGARSGRAGRRRTGRSTSSVSAPRPTGRPGRSRTANVAGSSSRVPTAAGPGCCCSTSPPPA